MTDDLVVLIEGEVAGFAARARRGGVYFSYRGDRPHTAPPLSLSVDPTGDPTSRIDAWLDGLLPDNPAIRSSWARRLGASSVEPFDLLSTRAGWECAGAVQFCHADELDAVRSVGGGLEPLDGSGVASALRELGRDAMPTPDDDPSVRDSTSVPYAFSLPGAQPKLALRYGDGTWLRPSGAEPTTHILKPPSLHLTERIRETVHVNEHLCMTAARALGLPAARTTLADFSGVECLVVERFDRRQEGERWMRTHAEDLCQALVMTPSAKYQADGGPGPEQVVDLIRRVGSLGDGERFVLSLVYNWLIGGTDAHAKNYSLMLSARTARLAPLYDVISYAPYTQPGVALRPAMWVGGESPLLLESAADWQTAALALGVEFDARRVVELADRLPSALEAAAEQCPHWAQDSARWIADQISARVRALR